MVAILVGKGGCMLDTVFVGDKEPLNQWLVATGIVVVSEIFLEISESLCIIMI